MANTEPIENETLEQKIARLERALEFSNKKLSLYENPSPAKAYYVGQKMLNQQINYLDKFDLESEIKSNPKDDKIYDRSISLFESLSTNASKINALKNELGLSGDEKKDTTPKNSSFIEDALKDG